MTDTDWEADFETICRTKLGRKRLAQGNRQGMFWAYKAGRNHVWKAIEKGHLLLIDSATDNQVPK